ncbi:MAG: hypothetical protein K2H21_04380 [Muribaculaceae bacterium]|nr:hypothetical protein [Muribaculaceae bacterium]
MTIQVFRTPEIDTAVWEMISKGYQICFNVNKTPDALKESFSHSITGYSIHAIKFDDNNQLMGHMYYQPRPYILNGEKVTCAIGGGIFVMPECRNDAFMFNDLTKVLDKECRKLGWIALMGVPNKNAFKYSVKINKRKYLGDLPYYLLPVRGASILKKKLPLINILSKGYSYINAYGNSLFTSLWNSKEKKKPLHLDVSDEFLNIRFDWTLYKLITKNNMRAIYRIYDEQGIKTAYLLHFEEGGYRSSKSLAFAVTSILKNENVDAIMYVGTMNFPQTILTKVPKRFVPQQLPLCIGIFDKKNTQLNETLSDFRNIDFGLINFDVR